MMNLIINLNMNGIFLKNFDKGHNEFFCSNIKIIIY